MSVILKRTDVLLVLNITRVIILVFAVLYLWIGAHLSAATLVIAAVVFDPLVRLCLRRKLDWAAAVLFGILSNFCLFFSSLDLHHQSYAEYFCLASILIPFLIVPPVHKKTLIFAIFWTAAVGLGILFDVRLGIPESWLFGPHYLVEVRLANFMGTLVALGAFVRIFFVSVLQARDQVLQNMSSSNKELQKSYLQAQESEKRLEEAQGLARIGSWSYDVASGKIEWSKLIFEFFALDPKNGEPGFEEHLLHIEPADRERFASSVTECLKTGTSYKFRYRPVQQEHKEMIWLEGIGHAVKDSQGKIIGLRGTSQDITDKVRQEEENKLVIESLNIGIWKFRPSDGFLQWDTSMYQLFGIDPKNFSQAYDAWESLLTPASKEKAVQELTAALTGEKEFNTTFEIQTPTGENRQIGGRGKVFRDSEGRPTMMYGINWDRTREIELERQLDAEKARALQSAKLASLGEMSAGVAHEINNPLAVVSGNIDMLERWKDNPEKFQAKLAIIRKSVERIARIVLGLQKFSRTSGTRPHQVHSLALLIQEAVNMTEGKYSKHQVEVSYPQDSKALIECDDMEISQVLINMINNGTDAIKNLPQKWIRFEIQENQTQVILLVRDSGPGIPKAVQDKLFQPFFTTKAIGEGTGLGLSIVRGILEAHGAQISVRNQEPTTCFELIFPKPKNLS
jgi:signal transduction histidine kinase